MYQTRDYLRQIYVDIEEMILRPSALTQLDLDAVPRSGALEVQNHCQQQEAPRHKQGLISDEAPLAGAVQAVLRQNRRVPPRAAVFIDLRPVTTLRLSTVTVIPDICGG